MGYELVQGQKLELINSRPRNLRWERGGTLLLPDVVPILVVTSNALSVTKLWNFHWLLSSHCAINFSWKNNFSRSWLTLVGKLWDACGAKLCKIVIHDVSRTFRWKITRVNWFSLRITRSFPAAETTSETNRYWMIIFSRAEFPSVWKKVQLIFKIHHPAPTPPQVRLISVGKSSLVELVNGAWFQQLSAWNSS